MIIEKWIITDVESGEVESFKGSGLKVVNPMLKKLREGKEIKVCREEIIRRFWVKIDLDKQDSGEYFIQLGTDEDSEGYGRWISEGVIFGASSESMVDAFTRALTGAVVNGHPVERLGVSYIGKE